MSEPDLFDELAMLGVPVEAEPVASAAEILERAAPRRSVRPVWWSLGIVAAAGVFAVLWGQKTPVDVPDTLAECAQVSAPTVSAIPQLWTPPIERQPLHAPPAPASQSAPTPVTAMAFESPPLPMPEPEVQTQSRRLSTPASVAVYAAANGSQGELGAAWVGRHASAVAPLVSVEFRRPIGATGPVIARAGLGITAGERAVQGQLAWTLGLDTRTSMMRTGPALALAIGPPRGPRLRLAGGADLARRGLSPRWSVGVALPLGRGSAG